MTSPAPLTREVSRTPSNDAARWARDPYPDYIAEVNRSIAFAGAEQSFFTAGKAKRAIDILQTQGLNPAAMSLLDIGCGVGLIHPYLASRFKDMVGVDVSAEALASARANNPSNLYWQYDGVRLPFADQCFDAEARRILRPGGMLMIFEHNPWNPLTRLAVSRCAFDYDAVLLSPSQSTRLLRQGGFVSVGREFLFFTPFPAAPIQRAEQALRWCPAGAQYVAMGRRAS
jgi:SAM-dependent methyltransferase